MKYRQYIEQYISDPHIVYIFTRLCGTMAYDGKDIKKHYAALQRLIYYFELFNDFHNNKNHLLEIKENMLAAVNKTLPNKENVLSSDKQSKMNKALFDYVAALNSVITHYELNDQLYPDCKIGVEKSLEYLKERELRLGIKTKAFEQSTSSLGKRKHLTFFEKPTDFSLNNTSQNTGDEEKYKESMSKSHRSEN